jgi:hypothetical protein
VNVAEDPQPATDAGSHVGDGSQPVARSEADERAGLRPDAAAAEPLPGSVASSQQPITAYDRVRTASGTVKLATAKFKALEAELQKALVAPVLDDAAIQHVQDLDKQLDAAVHQLEAAVKEVETAASRVDSEASASPSQNTANTAAIVEEARALARDARKDFRTARGDADAAAKQVRQYVKIDPRILLTAAEAAIHAGNLGNAQQILDKVSQSSLTPENQVRLEYARARLHDKQAAGTADPEARRKLLQRAMHEYEKVAQSTAGRDALEADKRAEELADELQRLDPP